MRLVVDEHDGLSSPCLAVSGEERAQLAHQRVCRGQCVGCGAGRANRRTLSAAGTDIGVDRDVIAGRGNRAGRAEIEATRAADDLRARMGAKIFGEGDIAGLVEAADEVARLEHRLEHGRQVLGIGS